MKLPRLLLDVARRRLRFGSSSAGETRETAESARVAWEAQVGALHEPVPPIRELASVEQLRAAVARLGDTPQRRRLDGLAESELAAFREGDRWPIPVSLDREWYWGDDHAAYWLSGLADYLFLREQVAHVERPTVLDFGCASGRVTRHFTNSADVGRVFGADLTERSIAWLRTHASAANLIGFQANAFPSLPLADRSIDLVFALSVFTHIAEFEESWLLELHRLLRPDGRAFVTFHSERSWQQLANPAHYLARMLSRDGYVVQADGRPVTAELLMESMPAPRVVLARRDLVARHAQVFHSVDYVRARWGALFHVDELFRAAHGTHQDAVSLRPR